jgi:hypothetical protein
MTFSYTSDLGSPLNQVRLMTGDVDTSDQQLQDEEILALTSTTGALAAGSIYLAAAQACELIASRYARQVTTKVGTLSAVLSDRMQHYRDRAKDLRRQNVRYGGVSPYLGGSSISDKQGIESNSDRKSPSFSVTTGDDQGGSSGTQPSSSTWWPN